MTTLTAILAVLATYRLTLLVTSDKITEPIREGLIRRYWWDERVERKPAGDPPMWVTLIDCPWCVSVWLGFPVAWSAWCFGERGWWAVPALALAGSAVAGFLATFASPES